jgi:hypothetical protein
MSHIFISYSHDDTDYAHRLEGELKRRGFEVWIDDRIDYGTRWRQALRIYAIKPRTRLCPPT